MEGQIGTSVFVFATCVLREYKSSYIHHWDGLSRELGRGQRAGGRAELREVELQRETGGSSEAEVPAMEKDSGG